LTPLGVPSRCCKFITWPPEIIRLRESDLPAAAEALNRAFLKDPLQSFAIPDPAERAARREVPEEEQIESRVRQLCRCRLASRREAPRHRCTCRQ